MSFDLRSFVLVLLCLAGFCLSQSVSDAQLIHRENFEGDASGYTLDDEPGYAEIGSEGDTGWAPGIWGLNTTGPQIGLVQSAPARRAAILWDHTPLADDFTEESLDVWVSLVDWSVGSGTERKDAKVGFFPGYFPESVEIVKDKLVAEGYTEANIEEVPTIDDVPNDLDVLIHSSEMVSTTFARLDVPLISFSGSDHDDSAIVGIGPVWQFADAVTLEVTQEFRNHPALGNSAADGVIEWTNTGVQLQGLGITHEGGQALALVDRPDIEEQGAAIFVIEEGQLLLGAFAPDPEGENYIVGAALNKFGIATERLLELKPVNVAGMADVKMTVALAATAADFELDDYLRIEVDPDGSGPAEAQILEEFWGVADTAPTCRKGLSNGEVAGETGSICLPTKAFGDFTFDLPAGATDAVVRFALFTTWGNEIIAIDDVRIHSGALPPPTPTGDFDSDGDLDAADIDALSAAVQAGNNPAGFDLNQDNVVNAADRTVWVNDLKRTYFGDANLDREFSSADFVAVFQVGLYETGNPAGWAQGDWDGNGLFNSGDFVIAFQEGGYEKGPHSAVSVPEPSALVLFALALLSLVRRRR
jgi:hypothetical protein